MRKILFSISSLLVAVVALGVMVTHIQAQEATPTPIAPTGVTGALLGSAVPAAAPDQTLSLRVTTMEPGGIIPLHQHPGTLVVWVQSGEVIFVVAEGPAVVTRAPVGSEDPVVETFGAGDEILLAAGDSIVEEGGSYTVTNPGDVDTVLYFAALTTTGEPVTHFLEPEA